MFVDATVVDKWVGAKGTFDLRELQRSRKVVVPLIDDEGEDDCEDTISFCDCSSPGSTRIGLLRETPGDGGNDDDDDDDIPVAARRGLDRFRTGATFFGDR